MGDRFFDSGMDVKVLLDWIDEIREDLLSLNLIIPGGYTDYYTTTSRVFLENNRLKTFDLYQTSLVYQDKSNNDLKKHQKDNEKIATQVIAENVLNQTLLDKLLEADRVAIQQKYEQVVKVEENEQKYKALNPEANNQAGYSKSYTPKNLGPEEQPPEGISGVRLNTINVAAPAFPKHNKPYNNHMEDITNDMLAKKSFNVFTGAANPDAPNLTFFKSWAKIKPDGSAEPDEANTFTPDKPYSDYISNLIRNSESNIPIGSYKFFIEKLHGRYSTGAPFRKNKIKSTKGQDRIPTELTNRMVFAAYINNYNDSYTVEKTEYNFIGRAEGFPVYKQTKRSLTLEFSIMADHSNEMMVAISDFYRKTQNVTPNNIDNQIEQIVKNFPDWGLGTMPINQVNGDVRSGSFIPGVYSDTPESLWTKMNFLAQCAYPYYRSDGKLKEQPMIRLRIADFYDVTGMITNFSIDLNELEGIQIDLNPSNIGNIPLAAKVTLSVDIYHDFEPSSNFFGFYHRKEFDEGTIDPVTGEGSLGVSKEKNDTVLENINKNSPVSIMNIIKNEKLLDTPSILGEATQSVKKDILNLRKSVNDIVNAGVKIADALLSSRTKKAMQAYMRIQKIVNVIRIQQGLPPIAADRNAQDGVNLFGNTIPNIKKGLDVGKTIKDQITNPNTLINPNFETLQSNYDNLIGSTQSIISDVTSSLKEVNNSLNTVGINIDKNNTLDELQTNISTQKYRTIIPKTIGDIIGDIRRKEGPNQDNNPKTTT